MDFFVLLRLLTESRVRLAPSYESPTAILWVYISSEFILLHSSGTNTLLIGSFIKS